jgi:hypothetical protein
MASMISCFWYSGFLLSNKVKGWLCVVMKISFSDYSLEKFEGSLIVAIRFSSISIALYPYFFFLFLVLSGPDPFPLSVSLRGAMLQSKLLSEFGDF